MTGAQIFFVGLSGDGLVNAFHKPDKALQTFRIQLNAVVYDL